MYKEMELTSDRLPDVDAVSKQQGGQPGFAIYGLAHWSSSTKVKRHTFSFLQNIFCLVLHTNDLSDFRISFMRMTLMLSKYFFTRVYRCAES